MEVARHGLTEKSTNILDGTQIKESELNNIGGADIKLVNGKSSAIHLKSQMDQLGNETDSNEGDENHEDTEEARDVDHGINGNKKEEIENIEKNSKFEDISDDEPGPVNSTNVEEHDSVEKHEPMDIDKNDITADESNEKEKLANIGESNEEKDNAVNTNDNANESNSETERTGKEVEKSETSDDIKTKNVEENVEDVVPVDSCEKSRGNDEATDKGSIPDKLKGKNSHKQTESKDSTNNSLKKSSQKSDDVIVLDDGDEESEKEKKDEKKVTEKKVTEKKAPIIVNYFSMSKENLKSSEISGKSSKIPSAKEQSGAKPQPVPEFAKDLRPMSMNLCTIGMNLVREHVYNDLIKIQSKKLAQNKLNDMAQKQLDIIKTAAKALQGENKPFKMPLKTCEPDNYPECGFLTESDSVMELHKDFPHGSIGNFHCSYCKFFFHKKTRFGISYGSNSL